MIAASRAANKWYSSGDGTLCTAIPLTDRRPDPRGVGIAKFAFASRFPRRSALVKPAVLIIARDPITGALLGSLVDVSGFQPVFPAPYEYAANAVVRIQPAVTLVDCDSDDGEVCASAAAHYGGAVILFSGARTEPEVRYIAARRGQRHFALPIRWMEFRNLLEVALRRGPMG